MLRRQLIFATRSELGENRRRPVRWLPRITQDCAAGYLAARPEDANTTACSSALGT